MKPTAACFLDFFIAKFCDCKVKKNPKLFWNLGLYTWNLLYYNSNAFFTLPPIKISAGFSNASFTATKNPTDSRPSMIL